MSQIMSQPATRRTKIVSTLGPASNTYEVLRDMIAAGVDIVRLNFSHGTPDDHRNRVELVRKAAADVGKIVGIMADLQGPKIRVSRFKNGKIFLPNGAEFILDASMPKDAGDEKAVSIDYKELPNDVKPGDILLLDDGRLLFTVKKVDGPRVYCEVKVGGELSNNKGINRQGGGLTAPALTDKDKEDLKTAVSLKVDYIAISFPRCGADIEEAKALIAQAKGNCGVIAKIERVEAIVPGTLDGIINASEGIMVARGDLAVEIGDAEVPAAQKYMIKRASELNKAVITATQMLETMIQNVVPTRAEVSDVANAVLDSTDAVMLSAETASGQHPIVAVKTMDRICTAAEKQMHTVASSYRIESYFSKIDEIISLATMYAANHIDIKAIISLTESGRTALRMSRVYSGIPIYGLSRDPNTLGRMALYRNVYPIEFDVTKYNTVSAVKRAAIVELQRLGYVKAGDLIIITCGDHIGVTGATNSMTILKVGDKE
jgi:pyruvate kinase